MRSMNNENIRPNMMYDVEERFSNEDDIDESNFFQ